MAHSAPSPRPERAGEDAPSRRPTVYRWTGPDPVSAGEVQRLADELSLPVGICEILVRRGYADPPAARQFLRPRLADLHPPDRLPDLAPAIECIEHAIEAGQTILIHGDYDVDGLTSTALLVRTLTELGGDVTGFVPHRDDGYDLGPAGLERARHLGARLIITADCGTTAFEAIDRAKRAGIDVVVTDHHEPGAHLPDAVAIVNPSRDDSDYRSVVSPASAWHSRSRLNCFPIKGLRKTM